MMENKRTVVALLLLAFSALTAQAAEINDNEDVLRVRLKNDFRRADRPSAGASARDIYGWVQGAMLDVNTHYYSDFIGAEAGAYYVYKLGAKDRWSTRGYLADHDSFGLVSGAVKLKPTDNLHFKIGRFGTDNGYGSLPYRVPLIASGSTRTMPTLSEGVLSRYEPSNNIDLWAMYRTRVFLWPDAAVGVRNEGIYNPTTGHYDTKRARSFLAGSWHDNSSRYSLGGSWQDDVSSQYEAIVEKKILLENKDTIKVELLAFHALLDGISRSRSFHNNTQVYSGQVTYSMPKISFFGAAGMVTHAMNNIGSNVDTDIGYPNSLSIDRNKEDMFSLQAGVQYFFQPNLSVMVAPLITHGYEDPQRTIEINGQGILTGVFYNVTDGALAGMKMYVASDIAKEKRNGSTLGNELHYWDVKAGIQYDFMLK
ncbi:MULTISPECIES: glucuronide uptake porin UidC [Kosakonia]|uniref:glucuronide uptake porin UidC n=1 Tax=Kosakonia TaxID=1330547 RepID=UPI0002730BCE|nr:putative glucuronide porin [Kosakonia radicincitans]